MGLGPLMAIYQARFLKYLHNRGLADTANRHVWAFLGDGEMDEPESLGAISLAGREKLDNLIFVVNCNLQRLDGPVRGNGKIIQELEGVFRGAGWNVIKVIWGSGWDPLLAADKSGLLLKRMEECVDGEYQDFKSKNGAYVREHFFGKYPELLDLVKDMSDDEIWALSRGGHDPSKVYAAYKAAVDTRRPADGDPGQDGQGLRDGRGRRGPEHHPPAEEDGRERAARVPRPVRHRPARRADRRGPVPALHRGRPEQAYLRERRDALGGALPARRRRRRAAGGAGAVGVRRPSSKATGGPGDLHDDGVRPDPDDPVARQADRQAGGADRPRRVAHLRHGGPVPPVRDLLPGRAALPARGRQPAHVLQGGQVRPDAAGGHQRGRRHVVVDRGRHQLLGTATPR